jgi:hypothetical protein
MINIMLKEQSMILSLRFWGFDTSPPQFYKFDISSPITS